MKPKVFLSSPFLDLEEYRQEVISTLEAIKLNIIGMEFFGARSEKPLDVCLAELDKSDVYIGILAMKYGSIDEDSGKSFTHIEYDRAEENSLAILIFLINELKQPVLPKDVDIGEKGILLRQFKDHLKINHTTDYFTTREDLAEKVKSSLLLKFKDWEIDVSTLVLQSDIEFDYGKIETFKHQTGDPHNISLNVPITVKTSFYLDFSVNGKKGGMVVYLRFSTTENEKKWIGFGTVAKIKNRFKSEHVFRIGYSSTIKYKMKENILDKISESGLDFKGEPNEIIKIKFRNESVNNITFNYGFD